MAAHSEHSTRHERPYQPLFIDMMSSCLTFHMDADKIRHYCVHTLFELNMHVKSLACMGRQPGREGGRQADRQRQTETETDRQIETGRHTDRTEKSNSVRAFYAATHPCIHPYM